MTIKKNTETNSENGILLCPKCSLESVLAFDPRDWAENRRDAWIYGIVVGWNDESLSELKEKYHWSMHEVERLKKLNASFNALTAPNSATGECE